MTKKEANEALLQGYPVICNEVEYEYVNAITWRVKRDVNGKIVEKVIQAELQDKNTNSVTVANIENVEKLSKGAE